MSGDDEGKEKSNTERLVIEIRFPPSEEEKKSQRAPLHVRTQLLSI
jgi:hypothetical protein